MEKDTDFLIRNIKGEHSSLLNKLRLKSYEEIKAQLPIFVQTSNGRLSKEMFVIAAKEGKQNLLSIFSSVQDPIKRQRRFENLDQRHGWGKVLKAMEGIGWIERPTTVIKPSSVKKTFPEFISYFDDTAFKKLITGLVRSEFIHEQNGKFLWVKDKPSEIEAFLRELVKRREDFSLKFFELTPKIRNSALDFFGLYHADKDRANGMKTAGDPKDELKRKLERALK
ncbi:MAG TPA: hypothetical protein VD908_07810 [Cytophagales bacterium]|nr:hypothetical protein [Cytophagales bacterium]